MPLVHSASKSAMGENIKREESAGKPKRQAVAIALDIQRKAKESHMAQGGAVHDPDHGGLVHSAVPGRTDRIPVRMKNGGYVIPADIVSSLGQGNSMAGANGLNKLLKMGPYGSSRVNIHMPRAPRHMADGGRSDVIIAGGEFTVPPEKVAELGNGDLEHGANILDALVKHVRANSIKTLKSLPGPKKS